MNQIHRMRWSSVVSAARLIIAGLALTALCGCSLTDALTEKQKKEDRGSIAYETAALATDTRRVILTDGIKAGKLLESAQTLVETATVQTAWTGDTVREQVEGTGAESRALLQRLRASLDVWDAQLAQVTATAVRCIAAVSVCVCVALLALAWKWVRR